MANTAPDDLLEEDPAEIAPGDIEIDSVKAGLAAEENLIRTRAAQLSAVLASEDIDRAVSLLPALRERLIADVDHSVILKEVLSALALLADDRPEAFEGHTDGLVPLLGHDLGLIRTFAARVIRPLAVARPDWFLSHVEALLAVLATDDTDPIDGLENQSMGHDPILEQHRSMGEEIHHRRIAAQAVAANLLIGIADTDPDTLIPHVPRLVELLSDDDPVVTAASAGAIASIAEDDPDVVSEATEPLCECLDSTDRTVVARAITALGFLSDGSAIAPLRELAADDDTDEELSELAADTADWLDADTN